MPLDAAFDAVAALALHVTARANARVRPRPGVELKPPEVNARARAFARACAEIDARAFDSTANRIDAFAKALNDGFYDPLVVRRACERWKASEWTLESLLRDGALERCATRVALTKEKWSAARAFTYCERSDATELRGHAFDAPTMTVELALTDAIARVLRWRGSGAYVQTTLESATKEQCRGGASDAFGLVECWRESQPQRLWLALSGSVSPMHFDASISTLAQVSGRKRVLLWPPEALRYIDLWPNWHPMRRRGRVDVTSPTLADDYPAFVARAVAWEVVLEPGDLLIFPPRWAHHTESLGAGDVQVSMSITQRFKSIRRSDVSAFMKWSNHRYRADALTRAVKLGLVRDDVGATYSRDEATGEVRRDLGRWSAPENDVFRRAALDCARVIREHADDANVVGIYVRGSIACGRAVACVSDVDLIVIARTRIDEDRIRNVLLDTWLPDWNHVVTKADVRYEYVDRGLSELAGEELMAALTSVDVFVLASQSVTIYGLDLPLMLPPSARVPRSRTLATLTADVDDALAHESERALVWCLKRLIRGAYEKRSMRHTDVYTRDLYHCVRLAIDADVDDADIRCELTTALIASVRGPKELWGELWFAYGSALCRRLERRIRDLAVPKGISDTDIRTDNSVQFSMTL